MADAFCYAIPSALGKVSHQLNDDSKRRMTELLRDLLAPKDGSTVIKSLESHMKGNAGRINLLKFSREVMNYAQCACCKQAKSCKEFECAQLEYRMWPGSLCKACSEEASVLADHSSCQLPPRTLHETMFRYIGLDKETLEYYITHGLAHSLGEGHEYKPTGVEIMPSQFNARDIAMLLHNCMYSARPTEQFSIPTLCSFCLSADPLGFEVGAFENFSPLAHLP